MLSRKKLFSKSFIYHVKSISLHNFFHTTNSSLQTFYWLYRRQTIITPTFLFVIPLEILWRLAERTRRYWTNVFCVVVLKIFLRYFKLVLKQRFVPNAFLILWLEIKWFTHFWRIVRFYYIPREKNPENLPKI